MVEIMLSSICDMKCVYCNHHYSSRWAKELLEFGEVTPELMAQQIPKPAPSYESVFWRTFESDVLPRVWYINLLGGEPLINDSLYGFLDLTYAKLRSLDRRGVHLNLVTNLNCSEERLQKFIIEYSKLSDYMYLDLNVSMEAYGARAEYIRYGLNWERWLKNLHTIIKAKIPNFKISMQMAHNTLSATSHLELLRLVAALSDDYDQPIQLRQAMVSSPITYRPTCSLQILCPTLINA